MLLNSSGLCCWKHWKLEVIKLKSFCTLKEKKKINTKKEKKKIITFISLCSLCTYLPWHPRFTFWLTFLQSYISSLFLIGLLSYLVEMKMRTSRHVVHKRDNSHFLCYVLLPWHPRFTFWLTFFQSCMLPLLFSGLLSCLVGIKRRTSRHVCCKRDNSHFFCYVLISPKVEILCGP